MTDILLFAVLALLVIVTILIVILLKKASQPDSASVLPARLDALEKALERIERVEREEAA